MKNLFKQVILVAFIFFSQTLSAQVTPGSDVPIVRQSFASNAMNTNVHYYVYLPGVYSIDTARSFPVIYWLHGSGGWPPGVMEMLATRFHKAIEKQKIPPAIVVFLDDGVGETMWVDAKDGKVKMETVVVHEVIPHVDKSFRTLNSSGGRILEGGSMGGYGAARFGFKYPHLFGAVSMLNPGPMQERLIPNEAPTAGASKAQHTLNTVYGGDVEHFRQLSPWQLAIHNADKIRGKLAIRMILGGADPGLKNTKKFSDHLNNLSIAHSVTILENIGHSPKEMFNASGDDYWAFFRDILLNQVK